MDSLSYLKVVYLLVVIDRGLKVSVLGQQLLAGKQLGLRQQLPEPVHHLGRLPFAGADCRARHF